MILAASEEYNMGFKAKYAFITLIHWVASLFFPEKSAGRAAFNSVEWVDMGVGARVAGVVWGVKGTGIDGAGVTEGDEASGSGVEVVGSWVFLG